MLKRLHLNKDQSRWVSKLWKFQEKNDFSRGKSRPWARSSPGKFEKQQGAQRDGGGMSKILFHSNQPFQILPGSFLNISLRFWHSALPLPHLKFIYSLSRSSGWHPNLPHGTESLHSHLCIFSFCHILICPLNPSQPEWDSDFCVWWHFAYKTSYLNCSIDSHFVLKGFQPTFFPSR